jgi:hypothetical protein
MSSRIHPLPLVLTTSPLSSGTVVRTLSVFA